MQPKLDGVPIFAGLEEASLFEMQKHIQTVRLNAQDVALREGELGNRLYWIVSGKCRVSKNFGTPHELTLAVLEHGDCFGEMCILETLPRVATVQALEPTQLHSLSSLTFYHLYQANPSQYSILILNIARELSRRLRRLDEIFAARH